MEPTISIVIPTHDRGELLVEAVESALAQADDATELVVVDDRSTDGSVEQLARFGNRVKVVRGSYGNAAAARNAGTRATSGAYIAFLDSDDLMLKGKTTCLVREIESDPTIALVHGTTEVIDTDGRVQRDATAAQRAAFAEGIRRGTTYSALAEFCAMFTSATLIRRSSFTAAGGYDESLDAYEDWDLYLRLSLSGRLVYADCLAARYRLWPGNVPWRSTALWTVAVAERHLAHLTDVPSVERARARSGFLRRLAESHHILVNQRAARRSALAAIGAAPAKALRDRVVVQALLLSLVPTRVLRGRRPN